MLMKGEPHLVAQKQKMTLALLAVFPPSKIKRLVTDHTELEVSDERCDERWFSWRC